MSVIAGIMSGLAAVESIAGIGATAAAGGAGTALAGAAGASSFLTAATPWIAAGSALSSIGGGVVGAIGQQKQATAEKNAALYNSQVAGINAAQSQQNAALSAQSGEAQAGAASQKSRAAFGQLEANTAASGLDVNSGSAVGARETSRDLGSLDAITVRSNALKEAYGYRTQAVGFENEKNLDIYEAEQEQEAGDIGAASTLLGGVGNAASNFARFQLSGGFGG